MKYETIVVGALAVNCYIVWDEETKEGVIIDPGAEGKRLLRILDINGIKLKYILNTHCHVDHIGANADIKEAYPDVPLVIHKMDLELLRNAMSSFIAAICGARRSPEPDMFVEDGDIITFGNIKLKVLHTPGHTPGSVCFYCKEGFVFTGDTLFAGSVGRVDLPLSQPDKLIPSIKSKLMTLEDDVIVLPGHGPESTIGAERLGNPFITGIYTI